MEQIWWSSKYILRYSNSISDNISQENGSAKLKNICILIFVATLFIIYKTKKCMSLLMLKLLKICRFIIYQNIIKIKKSLLLLHGWNSEALW